MKRNTLRVCTAVASLAALSVLPLTAHAEYKCASPSGSIEERACAIAATGPDALRRFVERTQNIYLLYYYDYARPAA
jgi:hypothetical protein